MGDGSRLQARWRAAAAPAGWIVTGALVAIMLLLAAAEPEPTSPVRLAVFTVVPAVVLGITLTVLAAQQHWLALGALLLAVSPTVLTATAAAVLPGAVAVLAASGVALAITSGFLRTAVPRGAVLLAGLAAMVIAWRVAGPEPVGDPLPLQYALGRTGQSLASVTGVIARAGFPAHTSAFLLWWLAIGVLVGAALVLGRWRDAALVPLTVVALGVLSVAIMLRRGTFDGRYLAWALAAAVSYTGAVLSAPAALGRRVGVAVGALAVVTWAAGAARMAKVDDPSTPLLTARIVIAVVLLAAVVAALVVTGRRRAPELR